MTLEFECGPLEGGFFWIKKDGRVLRTDQATLECLLAVHNGRSVEEAARSAGVSEAELRRLVETFFASGPPGGVRWRLRPAEARAAPAAALALLLGLGQWAYFHFRARTVGVADWTEAALVVGLALLGILAHECGHMIFLRAFTGRAPRMGLTRLFIFPAVYVDAQDAWALPRGQRLLIHGGGFLADLLVNTAAALWAMPFPALERFVTPFLLAQYSRWLIAANPFFRSDAYWLLSDFLNVVHLRRRGMESLFALKPSLFSVYGMGSLVSMALSLFGLGSVLVRVFGRVFHPH